MIVYILYNNKQDYYEVKIDGEITKGDSTCWSGFPPKSRRVDSRRKVKVNGKVVKELGVKVGPNDKVEVNEVPLEKEAPVYFLFYKPRGVISAVSG